MVFCSKCGTVNHSGKFCSKCGAILDQTAMSRETAVNAGIISAKPAVSTNTTSLKYATSVPSSPTSTNTTTGAQGDAKMAVMSSNQPRSDASAASDRRKKLQGEVQLWGSMRRTQILYVSAFIISTALLTAVVAPQWAFLTDTATGLRAHRGMWEWQSAWEVDSDCNPNSPMTGTPHPVLLNKGQCQKFYTVRAFCALCILFGLVHMFFLHFHHKFLALIACIVQVAFSMIAFSVADSAFREFGNRADTIGFILMIIGWVVSGLCVLTTFKVFFNLSLMFGYLAHFLFVIAAAHAEWTAVLVGPMNSIQYYTSPYGFAMQYDSDGGGPGVQNLNKVELIIVQGFGTGSFVATCVAATFMYSRLRHYAHYFYGAAATGCLLGWCFAIHMFHGGGGDYGFSFWLMVLCTLPLFGLVYVTHPDYNPEMIAHLPPEKQREYGNHDEEAPRPAVAATSTTPPARAAI